MKFKKVCWKASKRRKAILKESKKIRNKRGCGINIERRIKELEKKAWAGKALTLEDLVSAGKL